MDLDSLINYFEKLAATPTGVSVVGAFKDGKLLLGRRRDNEKWTQPGGHMEAGEKPVDGAVRELREEAGLELSPDRFEHIKTEEVDGKDGKLIIHCFVVKLKDGESTTVKDDPDEEVYKWHWLTPETIQSKEVWSNLHVPPQKNVLFKALGWVEQEKTASATTRWMAKISPAFKKIMHEKIDPKKMKQWKANAVSMFKGENPQYKIEPKGSGKLVPASYRRKEKLILIDEAPGHIDREHLFDNASAATYLHEKGHHLNALSGGIPSGQSEIKAWDTAFTLAKNNPVLEKNIIYYATGAVYGSSRGKIKNPIIKHITQFIRDKIKTRNKFGNLASSKTVRRIIKLKNKKRPLSATEKLELMRYNQDVENRKKFIEKLFDKVHGQGAFKKTIIRIKEKRNIKNLLNTHIDKIGSAEYAPGLPEKGKTDPIREIKKPEMWEFVLQKHDAEKRGTHYDMRIGDPKNKHGHSWVLPEKMPKPGEYIDIPRSETHTIPYFDFKGKIPEGTYGAGKVTPVIRSKIEVYKTEPGRISFMMQEGAVPSRYTIVGDPEGNAWRLVNTTPTRKRYDLPSTKVKVKEIKEPRFAPGHTHTPKLSGGHGIVDLTKSDSLINVFSYRPSKRHPEIPIDHTFKFPAYYKDRVKSGMGGTRLRGEIMAVDKSGKPVDEQVLGGILNSQTPKSRETQNKLSATLKVYLYNIDKYRGRDVSKKPVAEKDQMIKDVYKTLPKNKFELLPVAQTEQEQRDLIKQIKEGKHPLTSEGTIIRHEETGKLFKYKFRPDHDVYVREVFQEFDKNGKPKNQAGGFKYSLTPQGPIIGKVGTGFSRDLKQDMWDNKSKYIGRVAKVTAIKQVPKTGALFQPAFTGEWHIEKGKT